MLWGPPWSPLESSPRLGTSLRTGIRHAIAPGVPGRAWSGPARSAGQPGSATCRSAPAGAPLHACPELRAMEQVLQCLSDDCTDTTRCRLLELFSHSENPYSFRVVCRTQGECRYSLGLSAVRVRRTLSSAPCARWCTPHAPHPDSSRKCPGQREGQARVKRSRRWRDQRR